MKEFIVRHGTLIIAIIALIQNWLIFIYKKFFKKGEIDIFPSGTIEVGYSAFGPTIGLNGTVRCLNQDIFVSTINLEVIKLKDKSTHFFDWGVFRSQKLTYKGEEAEFELPYGFMLNTSQPRRYNIAFFDVKTRDEMQKIIRKVLGEWTDILKNQFQIGISDISIISKKYYDEFSKSKTHVDSYTALDRICYWESGEYTITLRAYTSKPNRTFEKKWKFTLKDEEVDSIRLNVVKLLQDTCMIQSYGQYNFAYVEYEGR